MPTDKLIEQRIKEKNQSIQSQDISDEQERSTNKMSFTSNHAKREKAGRAGKTHHGARVVLKVKMRKDDQKLYDRFLDMLKQYTYQDAQSIIERLQVQFNDEYEDDDVEDEAGGEMEGEEEEEENMDEGSEN